MVQDFQVGETSLVQTAAEERIGCSSLARPCAMQQLDHVDLPDGPRSLSKSLEPQNFTSDTNILPVQMQALHEDQQKQIEELTAQLQEAHISKSRLEMTNSRLETRCQLLEKLVSICGEAGTSEVMFVSGLRRTFPIIFGVCLPCC